MVPIPYALTYTTKMRGTVPKLVRCEQCQFEYVYLFKRSVEGSSTSVLFLDNEGAKERSATQAEELLQKELEQGCKVVPCPTCGHIQAHMIPLAQEERYRWPLYAAIGLVLVAVVVALPACLYTAVSFLPGEQGGGIAVWWSIVGGAAVSGILLFLVTTLLSARHDPNKTSVESRKQKGQRVAVSKEDFLKALKANES